MVTKSIPLSREFFFECPKCGVYRVSEETARGFLTPRLLEKLDDRFLKGAFGARLVFDSGCPRCEPSQVHKIELVALKRRVQ